MTHVVEIVYWESILTKGFALKMVASPSSQVAGRTVCVAHRAYLRRFCSPQRYVHVLTHGPRDLRRARDADQVWDAQHARHVHDDPD